MNKELTKQQKPKRSPVYELVEWVETILLALCAVILIFTFLFRIVVVSGSSMTNTLQDGDYLILSNYAYTPQNGDIVVVQAKTYEDGKKPLIKRVIATGGQWIDINFETWQVYVGDTLDTMEPIAEPYVLFQEGVEMRYAYTQDDYPLQVKEGHLFVMGDNRNGSMDSRDSLIGQIDENYVIGHAVWRHFPLKSFGKVG